MTTDRLQESRALLGGKLGDGCQALLCEVDVLDAQQLASREQHGQPTTQTVCIPQRSELQTSARTCSSKGQVS
jgi:hypothetical protein